jgi:hypothetical protein
MKTILPIVLLVALPAILASSPSLAQSPAGWQDDRANHMTGTWKLERKNKDGKWTPFADLRFTPAAK